MNVWLRLGLFAHIPSNPQSWCAPISSRQKLVRSQPFLFCHPHLISAINICLPFTADMVGTYGRRLYPSINFGGTATRRLSGKIFGIRRSQHIEKYLCIYLNFILFCFLRISIQASNKFLGFVASGFFSIFFNLLFFCLFFLIKKYVNTNSIKAH